MHNPPEVDGVDDATGEMLIQRDDDKEATVRKRLDVYQQQTRPLVDFYQKLDGPAYHKIHGVGNVENISAEIKKLLQN